MSSDLPIFLSLGAGVQSTTLALMAAQGACDLPMPTAAIFADTGWEPRAIYEHLAWLETQLPFQVHRVQYGNLRDDTLRPRAGKQMANPPLFTINDDGSRGMLKRQCTQTYKIEPVQRKVRELLGLQPRQRSPKDERCVQWIGISRDEAHRMKRSRKPFIRHEYPLVDLRMKRSNCVTWLRDRGYPEAPKSACIGCPYHADHYWRWLRDTAPEAWADAVDFDRGIRGGIRGTTAESLYVHASRVPLDEVDLRSAEERGQLELGFGNECEGVCGV